MASYTRIQRAEKGRLINIVCVLYVKPVVKNLWLSTITRTIMRSIDLSVTPVLEMPFLKNLDGYRWVIRKKIFVRSADTEANTQNSSMCFT
jgi:hypothetical protein